MPDGKSGNNSAAIIYQAIERYSVAVRSHWSGGLLVTRAEEGNIVTFYDFRLWKYDKDYVVLTAYAGSIPASTNNFEGVREVMQTNPTRFIGNIFEIFINEERVKIFCVGKQGDSRYRGLKVIKKTIFIKREEKFILNPLYPDKAYVFKIGRKNKNVALLNQVFLFDESNIIIGKFNHIGASKAHEARRRLNELKKAPYIKLKG